MVASGQFDLLAEVRFEEQHLVGSVLLTKY
jgi:hypothetical protein